MNNKKTLLISIAVLTGIFFYLYQINDTREDLTPSDTAVQDDPVLEQADNHLFQESGTDKVSTANPLEPEIREALEEMLDTSSEGLEEEEVNGAISVNLQGRFRNVPVATIDANGEIHIEEYSFLPEENSP